MTKKIIIGSDHAGFELKEFVKESLIKQEYEVKDVGTHSSDSCDYPDFAHQVAKAINDKQYERGILICGSGNGVCMTANKYSEVRAALCWSKEIAMLARSHNDANIICLAGRFIDKQLGIDMVNIFLSTDFEGGRHQRRIEKISKLL